MKRFWQGIVFGGLVTLGALTYLVPKMSSRRRRARRRIVMDIPRQATALFDEGRTRATRLVRRSLR